MCLRYPVLVERVDSDGYAIPAGPPPARRIPLVLITSAGIGVAPGDWLLVHSGVAVARISSAEAAQMLALLEEATANVKP